ncbi:hypothetical protein SERLADRAFT_433341 [Serpula lacrymans var. lacrymans S7.9]|uniref:Uncharacterized protein n=1 Tax=Serpula lacrymans var. lacrymans (strain S7.9) TaxID=578457 RepID=F8NGG3_SERL9|nr:uncharacterized protein SERLADRAFT_433341 [Serpula lacrymans var. lacrymans S7.9]EGO29350.1 hypothetical protein SERLADRAFT_433341 [Serpula lacrymans var. lacrymans S7.9]
MASADDPRTFNWLDYAQDSTRHLDIKLESSSDPTALSLLSPPSSPSFLKPSKSLADLQPSRRRPSPLDVASKRAKPYPLLTREVRQRGEDPCRMSNQQYGIPPSSGMRAGSGRAQYPDQMGQVRRPSDDGSHVSSSTSPYALAGAVPPPPFPARRSQSSSSNMATSSLTGAMGDTNFRISSQGSMNWASSQQNFPVGTSQHVYSGGPDHSGNPHFQASPTGSIESPSAPYHYPQYITGQHHPSPGSLSPISPGFGPSYSGQIPLSQGRSQQPGPSRGPLPNVQPDAYTAVPGRVGQPSAYPDPHLRPRTTRPTQERADDEIQQLHRRIRELELMNEKERSRVRELEQELATQQIVTTGGFNQDVIMSSLPSPLPTPSPQAATFQASWKARTDARTRLFCSLNRAGNALCAWHDSRRERRAYPPRMAPPGHLNCGCTFEEALFEESLSRHNVGSYHPGETVRMDPALRNPLLRLLQQRYGYRDGDFERNPVTGDWVEGEGHTYWEQKGLSGSASSRKSRSGDDRR